MLSFACAFQPVSHASEFLFEALPNLLGGNPRSSWTLSCECTISEGPAT